MLLTANLELASTDQKIPPFPPVLVWSGNAKCRVSIALNIARLLQLVSALFCVHHPIQIQPSSSYLMFEKCETPLIGMEMDEDNDDDDDAARAAGCELR